jgi:hypothetical protein
MVDQILSWLISVIPVALGLVVMLVPAKSEDQKRHMMWRYILGLSLIAYGGLSWWQQFRLAKASVADREKAIKDTSQQVAAATSASVTQTVTNLYSQMISDLNSRIAQLQSQLAAQGKDVSAIKGSNIVSGKRPIKVLVTNPSETPGPSVPNLSWSQDQAEPVDGKPTIVVRFRVDGSLTLPGFAAFCDRPCKRISGQAGVTSHYIDLNFPGQERVTGAFFDAPKPFSEGTSGILRIASQDGMPFLINGFRILKENEIPIELR